MSVLGNEWHPTEGWAVAWASGPQGGPGQFKEQRESLASNDRPRIGSLMPEWHISILKSVAKPQSWKG